MISQIVFAYNISKIWKVLEHFWSYFYCYQAHPSFQPLQLLTLCYSDLTEDSPTGLADGITTAADDCAKHLLEASDTDAQVAYTRRVAPDVIEGRHGEIASPEQCNTETAQSRQDSVAKVLATVEAVVAVSPNTVHRMGTIRFTQYIIELNLNMTVEPIWIPGVHT